MSTTKLCRPPDCDCANEVGADFKRFDLANGDFEVWYYCKKGNGLTEHYINVGHNPGKYVNIIFVKEEEMDVKNERLQGNGQSSEQ